MAEPIFAVVTPFQEDTARSVDLGALRDLLQFLRQRGVRRIVANGTTGEFPALSAAERRTVLETCRNAFPGEVIAHVSSCCADEVREAMAHARDWADSLLLLPPFYFAAPPSEGVIGFLAPLAAAAPLPLYLYNFPRHTQVTLTPDVVAAIREQAPVLRGLKDSSGELASACAFKERLDDSFEIYLGADGLALRALTEKLDGSVTGGAQPVPGLLVGLAASFEQGDTDGAREYQRRLDGWSAARKRVPVAEPAALKAALGAVLPGFPGTVRPPFTATDRAQAEELRKAVRRTGAR